MLIRLSARRKKYIVCLTVIVFLLLIVNNVHLTHKIANTKTQTQAVKNKPAKTLTKLTTRKYDQLPQLMHRDDFGWLLEASHKEKMIQIGVGNGDYARSLLKLWHSAKSYYGIDPWLWQKNYQHSNNLNSSLQNKMFINAKALVKQYGSKVHLIRNSSTVAVRQFKPNTIDFVYLDLRHDYCAVTNELNLYYPILKVRILSSKALSLYLN
jgi:hypothetical protein